VGVDIDPFLQNIGFALIVEVSQSVERAFYKKYIVDLLVY